MLSLHKSPANDDAAPRIAGASPANDDARRPHIPAAPDREACIACQQHPAHGADGLCDVCIELANATPRRCPGGCYGGLVFDPRGPSTHNPTGLRECPVCG